jgi:NAD(P)H-dependent flavin oxidoreductase YrpB (nitropropane dioxygenase family)
VIVGAGSPAQVPALIDDLSQGRDATLPLRVQYARAADRHELHFSPRDLMGEMLRPVQRPRFVAIVASSELATALMANPVAPDGFVVEGHVAGGHNAPPRGPLALDSDGQPQYGPADEVDCTQMVKLGKPFWLAGSYGKPGGLQRALRRGAAGIQVGTAFALCQESGIADPLKRAILQRVADGQTSVRTDPRASPTTFPFKVFQFPESLSDAAVYRGRKRTCDAGMLRTPFKTESGGVGYRCPAESETLFAKKGGRPQNTVGRMCLCNGLLATIGLGAVRPGGYREPPLITLGAHVSDLRAFLPAGRTSYTAADVIARLEAPLTSTSFSTPLARSC